MTTTATRRPTLATLKSFVRKNQGKLYIRTISYFDGMIDGTTACGDRTPTPVHTPGNSHPTHDLGIQGCWLVGSSRDYISEADVPGFIGYHVYNSCGSFDLLVSVSAVSPSTVREG